MYSNLFSPDSIAELTAAMQTQFPKAIWETFERHHQFAAFYPVPYFNDHGLPTLSPYHRYDRRHDRDHRSARGGGVPVCRASC